jgi:ribosomal protein L40E
MARKTIGYVKLEWTCPNCGSKNPGPQKTCLTCGGPQPAETAFTAGAGQALIQGEEAEKIAAQAADIHCPFCGARNPTGSAVCSQCGGDLKGGAVRPTGQVLGAYSQEPAPEIMCPNCGQPNPPTATHCKNCGASLAVAAVPAPAAAPGAPGKFKPWMIIVGVVVLIGLLIGCLALSGLFAKSEQVVGTVKDVSWRTSVVIEAYQPVERGGWKDEIPSAAALGACEYRYAYTSDQPQPVATEVCGTPYTVDQGTGFGEVVQDCTYDVYAEYCSYTVSEWVAVDQAVLQGSDLSPRLAQPALGADQRVGQASQEYIITFAADQTVFNYTTTDIDLFRQAAIGSQWNLTISGAGRLVAAEPVN